MAGAIALGLAAAPVAGQDAGGAVHDGIRGGMLGVAVASGKGEGKPPVKQSVRMLEGIIGGPVAWGTVIDEKELAKIADKTMRERFLKEVDFSKEKLVGFGWKGSGSDRLRFHYREWKGQVTVFVSIDTPMPATADLRVHAVWLVLPSGAKWINGNPLELRDEPGQIGGPDWIGDPRYWDPAPRVPKVGAEYLRPITVEARGTLKLRGPMVPEGVPAGVSVYVLAVNGTTYFVALGKDLENQARLLVNEQVIVAGKLEIRSILASRPNDAGDLGMLRPAARAEVIVVDSLKAADARAGVRELVGSDGLEQALAKLGKSVIASANDLAKVENSLRQQILREVDFSKEQLVLFSWLGPRTESLRFDVKDEQSNVTVVVQVVNIPSAFAHLADLPIHAVWVVMPKGATWQFEARARSTRKPLG
jgi:hypothetical protein